MASHHQSKSTSGFVPRRSNPTAIRSSGNNSHSYARPRSLSLYSPSSSPSTSSGSYGGLLGLHAVGGFGSNSPYLQTSGYGSPISTYGGTSSGYGGLTLSRTPSTPSVGLSSSPSRSSYYSSYLQTPVSNYNGSGSHRTLPSRSSSFNRALTSSRSSLSSALGSRSGSLSSLASTRSGSEGYASGGDVTSHSSRLSSTPPAGGDTRSTTPAYSAKDGAENGELDYKKLYEAAMIENDRLREKLKKTEEDLNERTSQLDKLSVTTAKNSLTELEKRERRAMERKLSEMEEELKQLQKLKAENERLKAENRALTRVVSKLTNSANATK
ncbi:hypothetical protein C0J52_08226 [Blattella germanica]|nr:hypothetical protein C0J52_08226 [Blattella germanica]